MLFGGTGWDIVLLTFNQGVVLYAETDQKSTTYCHPSSTFLFDKAYDCFKKQYRTGDAYFLIIQFELRKN